ncbi:MAG: VWA domain-containing protein [Verrucomicrobiales bacterium]|nr:VWA domain-containing protein [Verrucomicrobiales bacterium]
MNNRYTWAAGFLLTAASALADSITPASFDSTLNVGESVTIKKTVTVDAGTPTSSKVDVFFLADTTGSMGGAINGVRNNASSLLSAISGLGDVQFAVGEYKDFPRSPYGGGGDFSYKLNTPMTANTSTIQTGINQWGASGGADGPESQLAALKDLAESSATGWRPGSARVLIWFGDIWGHDSATEPAYPGPTEAQATAALVNNNIQVEAIDVGSLNGTGQAGRIAAATGGHVNNSSNSSAIVAVIQSAIDTAFANYSSVALDLSEVPAGLSASVDPASITGAFDRSATRSFDFELTLTADAAGTYTFNVYGLVDGGRVATETDRIHVPGIGVPDRGATLSMMTGALLLLGAFRRRLA